MKAATLLAGVLALVCSAPAVEANDYPNKPITLIIGFAPGGPSDVMARILTKRMEELLRQPVIIEHRAGAGGGIAATLVARAPADGYTILLATGSSLAINVSLYKNLGYNPETDFEPISLVGVQTNLLYTHPGSVPAKTLAEFLFGDEQALITLDMSEYMEKHTVSRLVGSPPGYVGYEEGGQLTEAVRRKPFSVVLFDEIEKAHPDVFNTLLQILEEGRLTDSQGRTVDFRNTVLIMTSNLGTQDLRKANVGFNKADEAMSYSRMKDKVTDALKAHFRPEFLNRVDDIIVFHELAKDEVMQMVDLMTKRLTGQLEGQGLGIELTQAAKELLADKGYDPQLGARPLRRAIQRMIEDVLSEKILYKEFHAGEIIVVDTEDDPDRPGEQRLSFRAVEGFRPPSTVELAATGGEGEPPAPTE